MLLYDVKSLIITLKHALLQPHIIGMLLYDVKSLIITLKHALLQPHIIGMLLYDCIADNDFFL
jgi:hypothetical protein